MHFYRSKRFSSSTEVSTITCNLSQVIASVMSITISIAVPSIGILAMSIDPFGQLVKHGKSTKNSFDLDWLGDRHLRLFVNDNAKKLLFLSLLLFHCRYHLTRLTMHTTPCIFELPFLNLIDLLLILS